ncbi:MAG TPA: ImmA/IrrE family metallo-endopeptidase [Gammaproteobacteria bacterium]|nr:ImmA/IrrE family metallo-endopeptidase [Gammaproteobacteria bacterium]
MKMKNYKASAKQITDSRQLLQNQYAHQNDDGEFDGVVMVPVENSSKRYQQKNLCALSQHERIKCKARELQKNIWNNRKELWPGNIPDNPIQLLDPRIAIQFIGYKYDQPECLGEFSGNGATGEIAGVIDRSAKQISISRRLSPQIRRFTAAHELGHAILHKEMLMHRDRPIDGSVKTREPMELEADKFASYFLMPEKLIRERFRMNFGVTSAFVLTDDTAFALDPTNPEGLINRCKTLRNLSKILAKAEQYNVRHVYSMANQFGVSVEAMAIRLEELQLVKI